MKDRASFLRHDFEALAHAGVLGFVDTAESGWFDGPYDGPYEGLSWFVSCGHTPYQLHPLFGKGEQKILFSGDIVPTSRHLRLGWVMAYDVLPMTTIEEKQMIYRHCLDDGTCLAFPHDPEIGVAELSGTAQRVDFRAVSMT